MSNRSVEFLVSLGLKEAQNLLNTFRDMLQKSVKVDSSAFKDIERLLDKLATLADGLKGKMGEAFKTSASSRLFLKQYELLFTALDAMKGKFTSLGLNDIAFSNEDSQFVNDTIAKIRQLHEEIENLEKGKIGKLFDDNTIDGADKIRTFVAGLGKDLNSMTFTGLSAALGKELKSVLDDIASTEKSITSLRSLINALSGNLLDELMTKMNAAIHGAVDQSSASFKPELILEYRQALDDFYSTYSNYTGGRNERNDTTGSVEAWIKKEAAGIADGIGMMKQKFAEYQQALADLDKIQSSGVKGAEAKSLIDDIASRLGLNFDASSFTRYDLALSALRTKITELKGSFTNEADITDLGQKMLESLAHVFDHVDLNRTLNITNLKSQLTAIFKEIGVDVSDPAIAQIFNSITKNMNVGDFSAVFSKQIEEYRQKHEETARLIEADNLKLKASEQELKDMLGAVNTQVDKKDESIKEKTQDIESLSASLLKLVDDFNKANGTNFQLVPTGNIEQGKRAIESYAESLSKLETRQKALSNISMAVTRWMGFYQVLNLTKRAVNLMKLHIQELDSVMTRIAVVTNMTQSDLWNQIGKYSEIARQYGVAIKGVYEVSQIYYQQGLNKGDVMGLTTETLKMARIAGIDYATAADYMTTAIRGFKLEMSDAAHVTDVFSNLAAHTASSTEELATAISKTAASAASVGASFEATSAMMATMIATTRESATNIGTALKSIISRYGELKENKTGTDSEGEEYSLNKVDKALQTIGITIHDTAGQFRDFDDVIMELAEKWDTIDKNAQRYVATVMAGNRQQSRFLALVSNVEQYKRALELALNSDDTGEIQTLKTLDSIDAKIERMKVTIQEFYTSSGILDLYKNVLDTITNIISGANELPKIFGNIPIYALAIGTLVIAVIKNVLKLLIASVSAGLNVMKGDHDSLFASLVAKWSKTGIESGQAYTEGVLLAMTAGSGAIVSTAGKQAAALVGQYAGALALLAGSALTIQGLSNYGASTSVDEDRAAGKTTLLGTGVSILGSAVSGAAIGARYGSGAGVKGIVVGSIIGGLVGVIRNISSIISGVSMLAADLGRRIELALKTLTESQQKATVKKGETAELQQAYDKLSDLYEKLHDSVEAMQEYHDYMNQLADQYPKLVSEMLTSGDLIIELADLERELANARIDAATAALLALRDEKKLKTEYLESSTKFSTDINKEKFNLNKRGLTVLQFASFASELSGFRWDASDWNENTALWAKNQQTNEAFIMRMYDWATNGSLADSVYASLPRIEGLNTFDNESEVDLTELYYKNLDKIDAWYELILERDANGLNQAGDYLELYYSDTAKQYANVLNTIKEENSDFDYAYLTHGLASTEDEVKKLTGEALFDAVEYTRNLAKQYSDKIKTDISSLDESINRAAIDEELQLQIANADPSTSKKLLKYTSLANFLIRTSEEYKDINFGEITPEGGRTYATELYDAVKATNEWIEANLEYAEAWSNIDYSKFANYQELVDNTKGLKNSIYEGNFRETFEKTRNTVREALVEQLKNVFGKASLIPTAILQMIGTETESGTLTTEMMSVLQSKIKDYLDLKDKGYTVAASNYYNGLIKLLEYASEITDVETRSAVTNIIKETDLTDITAIDTAITSLKDIAGTEELVKELTSLKNKIVTSIGLTVESIVSSSIDKIKEVEKTIGNVEKGMDYSAALEAAQEILDKAGDKTTLAQSLIYLDIDTGKWMLSQEAIYTSIENVKKDLENSIKNAMLQLTLANEVVKDLIKNLGNSNAFIGKNPKKKFALNITNIDWKKLGFETELEFTDAVTQFEGRIQEWLIDYGENKDDYDGWEDYLNKRYEELNIAERKLLAAQDDFKNVIKSSLTSFDYSSIAGGTYTSQAKALLLALLHTFDESLDPYFETIWNELLDGKFDTLEELTNIIISSATKKAAKSARVTLKTTAMQELMSGVTYESASLATLRLINQIGMVPAAMDVLPDSFDLWPDTDLQEFLAQFNNAQVIIEKIQLLLKDEIDGINYTVEQYNNDLISAYEAGGLGILKAGIDLFSGSFSLKEFSSYILRINPGAKLDEYFDSSTQQFLQDINGINLNSLFTYDSITDTFKANIELDAEIAINSIATALSIGTDKATEIWNELVNNEIAQLIASLDALDVGKQAVTLLSNFASAGVGTRVLVNKIPEEIRAKMGITSDEYWEIASEYQRDSMIMALDENTITEPEYRNWVRALQRQITEKRDKNKLLSDMFSKNITMDAARTFMATSEGKDEIDILDDELKQWMQDRGYIQDALTKEFKATEKTLIWYEERIKEALDLGASDDTVNLLLEQANQIAYLLKENPARDALLNLLSSYENVGDDILAKFKAQFDEIDIDQYITEKNGVKKLNVERLKARMGKEYSNYFNEYIALIADSYIESTEKIGNLLSQGTTSQVEMQGFLQAYSELMGGQTIDFFYDSVLQAWTIDASKIREYLKQVAGKLGLGENAALWVEDQIQTLTVDNLDFSNYLSGSASQKDQAKLKHDLLNYFKANNEFSFLSQEELNEWALEKTNNTLASLDKGGQAAIDALKSVKGELTTEEVQSAYRAQIAPIKDLYNQIDELQVGSVVATNLIEALTKAGFTVNADGVVTAVGNLVEAYKSLYDQMEATGEATLAELNETMGKYLDNRDNEQQAIDALSNAANMTYSQLAEIYTQAGIKLTEELVDAMEEVGIIKGLGGNKLMIQDFRAFAKQMNWSEGSEEYINAFKTYNDSLIEYDRQIEKSIVEEIKNVAAAKPGDKINLTHFVSILEKGLDTILETEGAIIYNGILTISEGADLADITNLLLAMIPDSVELIPEEIAEIADAVNAILQQIVSLIKEGINGTLSNANKQSLMSWGNANGLDLLFTQTAEGFKLAQASAIEVYNTLKSIDALQGKLVFDELNKSLQETNEHYKSISDIANRIKTIESIAPDARSKEYAQELALAKEIYAVRSTTDDSSFSFMSNKIPGAQNNPINYFNNWASAIRTFNDALKTKSTYFEGGKSFQSGVVDYDYWYNLVTEMNNIAKLGGNIEFAGLTLDGSLEAASRLIQKGAESLVVTDTGEIKVALSKISVDFESGADAFSGGVTEGIQALAKSQSKMLDGLIKLLEAVVAMEKLGDIDVGSDGIINLEDLFVQDHGVYTIAQKNLDGFNAFIQQAGDSLDSIIINGEKFSDLAGKAKTEGLEKGMAENFTAIMNSLYQMYKSGDYNLDNLYDSIQLIMAASKFTGTVQLGDTILHVLNGAIIIESEDDKGKKKFLTSDGKSYDTMDEAIARAAIMAQGVEGGGTFNTETKIASGTLTVKTLGTSINIEADKNGKLKFNGVEAANISEYIQNLIDNDPSLDDELKILKKLSVNLELGNTKLDSITYRALDELVRSELENAFATGDIDKIYEITAKPEFKSLEGMTPAEMAKQLGIEAVNVDVDATVNEKTKGKVKKDIESVKPSINVTINKPDTSPITDTLAALKLEKTVKLVGDASDLEGGSGEGEAAGNVGAAKAKGTLMGELGPELVVSQGRYFVAGLNGPEMVNLADDAIVFNHLLTKSLLEKGTSTGRGHAITSERRAVSYAKGNINGGPAHASASAALAALRQLKAQWDALAGLSAKDLAGKGGGGGGGGGDPKAFLKDLERWYDWLQQIAQLEKEITLEEAKRTKYQNDMIARGKEYFTSQMDTLKLLQEQAVVQQSLNDSQEEYFKKRIDELNNQSAFSALYGFSETGQLYYKDVYADGKSAFEWLSDLVGRDEATGKANYTAEEQYNKLVAAGFEFAMQYDSSGNEIKHEGTDWYNTALQAFWDKIDRDKEEAQSLHDSIEDGKKKVIELENQLNEILHEIEDNLIEVEQKVLKAVEESRQRAIDQLKDNKDALEEGAKALTDGLSKQLDNERKMLDNQKNADELASLQRRLGILQRSGGSASLIADLQQLINDKQQDKYFDMQEQQIQAILDASDAELERLDRLIELEEESLEYEKEHGMLWMEVDDILQKSSEDIVNYIQGNTSEYWSKSTTELQKVLREDLFEVDRFKQFQATVEDGMDALIELFGSEEQKKALADKKRADAAAADAVQEAANAANTAVTGGNGGTPKPTNNPAPTTVKKAIKTSTAELLTGKKNPTTDEILALGKGPLNTEKNITLDYKNKAFVLPSGLTIKDENLFGSDPKAVLNSSLIKTLKDLILTPKDSVKSLVASYNEGYKGLSSSVLDSIQNNSNTTTIGKAEVNLNIDKIADNYDVKRMADTVVDTILNIRSKTAANNSVR